jgi:hypothetical protein
MVASSCLAMKNQRQSINFVDKRRRSTIAKYHRDLPDPARFAEKSGVWVGYGEPGRASDVISQITPLWVKSESVSDPYPLS